VYVHENIIRTLSLVRPALSGIRTARVSRLLSGAVFELKQPTSARCTTIAYTVERAFCPAGKTKMSSERAFPHAPRRREIIVIGASAGGLEAIANFLHCLPPQIRASFFVVSHVFPDVRDHLVNALNVHGGLTAKYAEDGEPIRPGVVYVACPDRHLLVKHGSVRVTRGPRENRWRPAIDPLFRSAAVAYGSRVVGVVLSGMLDDGTAGLLAIKRCGGIALVQEPEEAAFPDMPRNALANVAVDHCLPIAALASKVGELVEQVVERASPPPNDVVLETRIAETGYDNATISSEIGDLTALSCPECGGPLWQNSAGTMPQYRCRVGHAFGSASLADAQHDAIESALWAAVRLLDQRANVLATMADKDGHAGRARMAAHHAGLADEARGHAGQLRKLLSAR
jgi:two-component system chemotaxis response regulator CheB